MKNVQEIYELSPTQEGILFHCLYAPEESLYVVQARCDLRGDLDVAALRAAVDQVVARHAILRTSFLWEGLSRPVQVVHERTSVPFEEVPLARTLCDEGGDRLACWMAADRERGFDLAGVPIRWTLLHHTGSDRSTLVFTHHHLLLDGWSLAAVLREVGEAYAAISSGAGWRPEPAQPHSRFVSWLRGRDHGDSEGFWRDHLADAPCPSAIEVRCPADEDLSAGWGEVELALGTTTSAALRQVARRQGVSLASVLYAAWAVLLGRYTGQDDVVFGTAFSGRTDGPDEAPDIVGILMATLPFRLDLDGTESVADLLQRGHKRVLALLDRQFTPPSLVKEWSGLATGSELFDTVFVVEGYPVEHPADWNGVESSPVRICERPHYPLTVAVQPGDDAIGLKASFDRRRITQPTARQLLQHLRSLLAAVAADPNQIVRDLPMLAPDEQRRLAAGPASVRLPERCVHEVIAEQCARTPDAVAVTCGSEHMTYAQLAARSDDLAAELRELGVGPDVMVAVSAPRSPELVVGLLAVLKAGGAYLPLDPALPPNRVAFMLEDSCARIALVHSAVADQLPAGERTTLLLDRPPDPGRRASGPAGASLDDLAYMIYTSGSTGTPKGVMIDHRALASYVEWAAATYDSPAPRGSILHGSVGFDLVVTALYAPLVAGRSITVLGPDESLADVSWPDLNDHAFVKLTPSHVSLLLARPDEDAAPVPSGATTTFVIGGEDLAAGTARSLLAAQPDVAVVNEYGPTEATVGCIVYSTDDESDPALRDGSVPIGRPIPGVWIRVLAPDGSLTPPGAPGELYLGGPGLARGYWQRPEQTASRFGQDPHGGGLMYRTGDVARLLADGNLEYLGRRDLQVKVRGYRVELGEIEHALGRHDDVAVATVALAEDRLVAYVVWQAGSGDRSSLLDSLRRDLPDYMVPSVVVELERLPLTANGKVDSAALPTPTVESSQDYVAPRTPVEATVAAAWAELLGCERVGAVDDFFELGGHSLLATRVAARLQTDLGRPVPLRLLFENPTVERLAQALDQTADQTADQADAEIAPRPAGTPAPLSFGQEQLWLLDQLEPGRPDYNVPRAIRLRGDLDRAALEQAVAAVVADHEVTRSRFGVEDDVVHQDPGLGDATLVVSDLNEVADDEEAMRRATQLVEYDAATPFDLTHGPLLRIRLIRLRPDDHLLLVVSHHIVTDAWSTTLFWEYLLGHYEAALAGNPPSEGPSLKYGDYAWWQRTQLTADVLEPQLDHWREQLAGLVPTEVQADRPRPAVRSGRGEAHQFAFSPELSEQLHDLVHSDGRTLYMALLAGFLAVLSRYSGSDDVAVGTTVSGRTRAELHPLLGYFVNTVVLRADLADDPSYRQLLDQVRDTAIAAYGHQDVPFHHVVEQLRPDRDRNRTPFFQVMFEMEEAASLPPGPAGLDVAPHAVDFTTAKFDVEVMMADHDGIVGGVVRYDAELFDPATITRFVDSYRRLLESAVDRPDRAVSQLTLVDPTERDRLLGGAGVDVAAGADIAAGAGFEIRSPETDAELLVAEVWADVLGTPVLDTADDFFAVGGKPVLARRLMSKLGTALDFEMPETLLFSHPTVAELAEKVEEALLAQIDRGR